MLGHTQATVSPGTQLVTERISPGQAQSPTIAASNSQQLGLRSPVTKGLIPTSMKEPFFN